MVRFMLFKTINVSTRKYKIKRTSYEVNLEYYKKWFFKPRYTINIFRGADLIGKKSFKEPILEHFMSAVHGVTSVRLDDSAVAEAISAALIDLRDRIEEAKRKK